MKILLPAGFLCLLVIAVSPIRANCKDKAVKPASLKEYAIKLQAEKIVSPALLRELKIYSMEVDSLNRRNNSTTDDEWSLKIINIHFCQRDEQRYLSLSPGFAYIMANTLAGYFMLGDKLVMVYRYDKAPRCSKRLVRMSKLQKGRPPGQFRDRESLGFYTFDYDSKWFKIKDNGELEFDSYVW